MCSVLIGEFFKHKVLLQQEGSHGRWGKSCLCLQGIKSTAEANGSNVGH